MKNELLDYITKQLKKRGWPISEMARRMNIGASTASMALKNQRKTDADFCLGVARAFNADVMYVLSLEGLVPPTPEQRKLVDPQFVELTEIFDQLSPRDKATALYILRGLVQSALTMPDDNEATVYRVEKIAPPIVQETLRDLLKVIAKTAAPEQMEIMTKWLDQVQPPDHSPTSENS